MGGRWMATSTAAIGFGLALAVAVPENKEAAA